MDLEFLHLRLMSWVTPQLGGHYLSSVPDLSALEGPLSSSSVLAHPKLPDDGVNVSDQMVHPWDTSQSKCPSLESFFKFAKSMSLYNC